MLITLIPFFDAKMAVSAYSFFSQRNNNLLEPSLQATGANDGAGSIPALELINKTGLEALTGGKEVFVPLTNINIFADIPSQYSGPLTKLVLLLDKEIKPEEMYVNRITELKKIGYRFAFRRLEPQDFEHYQPLLALMDYLILDDRKMNIRESGFSVQTRCPGLALIAGNIESTARYEELRDTGFFGMFEGEFFRLPINKGQHDVSPLKTNYIQLLNIVNNNNFELSEAADVIGQDTALVISLLKMVNTRAINSEITSIRHAAAMLGQRELKQWINTAVIKELTTDKPNEIARVSLIRAKFLEKLAPAFELAVHGPELFLMGLFSVIDVILDQRMEEALQIVQVSRDVQDALTRRAGKYAPIYDFVLNYESAGWQEVSRQMILHQISLEQLYKAYMDTLSWYSNLVSRTE